MQQPISGVRLPATSRLFIAGAMLIATFWASLGLALAQSFVTGFSSKEVISPGFVVALAKNSKTTVELVPGTHDWRVYGVVVDPSEAAATVAEGGKNIFVATSGSYPILVSIENGVIEAGDYLSISATDGIAAKATGGQTQIVGRAQENYSGTNGSMITQTATGNAIGRVLADVAPGKNPLRIETLVPGPLRRAAETIAGKSVSAVRLYGALVVFAAAVLTATIVLWIGVRTGMIAIGRNPLSKSTAMKGLAQVLVMSFLIFVTGIIGVYLLLKL